MNFKEPSLKHRFYRRFMLCMILVAFILPVKGYSQNNTAVNSDSFQFAKSLLLKMSNYLSKADQFGFDAIMTEDEFVSDDYLVDSESISNVVIKRPNMVYTELKNDYGNKRFWYNGKSITLLTEEANYFATAEVKGDIETMFNTINEDFGISLPLVGLSFEDPYKLLLNEVIDGFYLGVRNINNAKCHHLLFVGKDVEWQIWIETGKQIVPRKYVVRYVNEEGAPKFSAEINNWSFNEYAPDEMFNFTAPSGSEEIEFVIINN